MGGADKEVAYKGAELNDVQLAWATTIHKAQGSECPVVVLVMSPHHRALLSRRLLYTGLLHPLLPFPTSFWSVRTASCTNLVEQGLYQKTSLFSPMPHNTLAGCVGSSRFFHPPSPPPPPFLSSSLPWCILWVCPVASVFGQTCLWRTIRCIFIVGDGVAKYAQLKFHMCMCAIPIMLH